MDVNPDYRDLFRALNDAGVRFLVVGAHAVAYHTEPRYTKDIDIWVDPAIENAERVWAALHRFGAPLQGVTATDFTNSELVYQIGVEPNRIDVMMGLEGVAFATAWKNRIATAYGGIRVYVLGKADLLRAKRAAGRPQDRLDVRRLTSRKHQRRLRQRGRP